MEEKADTTLTKVMKRKSLQGIINDLFYFLNIVKKSFFWILLSYLIPLINIAIIFFVTKKIGTQQLNMINIILATNSCFIIGTMNYIYSSDKERETANFLSIVALVICICAFGISTYEISKEISDGVPQNVYNIGAIISFIICLILAYIAKKDEDEKKRILKYIIGKSQGAGTFQMDGQSFNL